MTFKELQHALAVFDLPENVTLKTIKARHRQLVQKYHPDKGAAPDNDKIRQINSAYKLLNEYVEDYSFDFSQENFLNQNPEERLREQFYNSGLWRVKGEK